ncbi:baseplate J/gp47 family protein [Lactobacillus crispatus]|uniref:baseplate J/gp47 family protein n=1 Tax=Lactobacillus crispatus TaxID=47770 RepID=UPI003F499190
MTRKVDAPSHAEVVITTEGEYLIQAGEKFETEDGLVFDLTEDVITSKQSNGAFQGTGNVECEETGEFTNV